MATPPPDTQPAPGMEHPTPVRAKMQIIAEWCDANSITYSTNDLFLYFIVPKRSGWRMLQPCESARRHRRFSIARGTIGRPKTIGPEKLREMEQLLETEGFDARAMTWEALAQEVGIEASVSTIRRSMGTLDHHKCVACRRGWVSPRAAACRAEWARLMLE